MNEVTKKALWHGVKVFVYAGVSAVVPVIIAYLSKDPAWLALVPVINALWASVDRYVKESNLLAGKSTPQA